MIFQCVFNKWYVLQLRYFYDNIDLFPHEILDKKLSTYNPYNINVVRKILISRRKLTKASLLKT